MQGPGAELGLGSQITRSREKSRGKVQNTDQGQHVSAELPDPRHNSQTEVHKERQVMPGNLCKGKSKAMGQGQGETGVRNQGDQRAQNWETYLSRLT